jgi:hypothetical protein
MNPGFRQCLAEVLRSRHFHGTNAQEQHLYLLIESGGVREQAVVGGLATESAAAAAAPAEPAEIGEPVEIGEDGQEGLHAAQSLSLGLHNLDRFAYIAAFSGGGNRAEWEKADSNMLNQKLRVLWIGCGTEDTGYNGVKGMADLLTKKNVKHVWNESGGGHSWPNWGVLLSKYAPCFSGSEAPTQHWYDPRFGPMKDATILPTFVILTWWHSAFHQANPQARPQRPPSTQSPRLKSGTPQSYSARCGFYHRKDARQRRIGSGPDVRGNKPQSATAINSRLSFVPAGNKTSRSG